MAVVATEGHLDHCFRVGVERKNASHASGVVVACMTCPKPNHIDSTAASSPAEASV